MTGKLILLEERVRRTVEGAHSSVEEIVENVKDMVDTTVATVKQTVEGAQASVEGMVESVKGAVTDTVATVKHTFDAHYQVERHPWRMVGGATLVGYLLGSRGVAGPLPLSPPLTHRPLRQAQPPRCPQRLPGPDAPLPYLASRPLIHRCRREWPAAYWIS